MNVPTSLSSTDLPFPWKVHLMLEYAEKMGLTQIVSWMPSGNAFKVHNRDIFSKRILPQFFRHSNFKSFQRNLSVYSFTRIWVGPESGSYTHRFFLKNDRTLCQFIVRQTKASTTPPPTAAAPAAATIIHPNVPGAIMDRAGNENQMARNPETLSSTPVAAVAALPQSSVLGSLSEGSCSSSERPGKRRKKPSSTRPSPGGDGEDKKMPFSSVRNSNWKKQEEGLIGSSHIGAKTGSGRSLGRGVYYTSIGGHGGDVVSPNRFMPPSEHSLLSFPEDIFAQNTDTIKWMYDSGCTNTDLWNMLDLRKQPERSATEASKNITDFDLLPPTAGGVLPHQLSPNSLREICSLLSNINNDPFSLAQNNEEVPAKDELLDQLWNDTLTTRVGTQNSDLQAFISSFSFSSGEMLSDDDGGAATMMFQGQQGGAPPNNIPFLEETEDPFD